MTFEAWLTANGYDAEKLSDAQKKHLTAAWKAETQPPPVAPPVDKTADPQSAYQITIAKAKANATRVQTIQEIASEAIGRASGNRAKIDRFESLCTAAAKDENTTVEKFRYDMLLEDRNHGPIISVPQSTQVNEDVVEAAICIHHKLPNVETGKIFSDQTLDAARKQFRYGVSLKQLLRMGARANGFRGEDSDAFTLAKYAMRNREDDQYGMRSDVGPSTGIQVPGILSNIANKFIAPAFMYTEQSWRRIAKISPVNDFKTKTTYRMTGANTYKKVAKSGEIKHGSLGELTYTDQAETYGILLGVSREDMINDDLGAFTSMSADIGRGAGEVLNNVFWTEWLDDAAFFTTALLNYDDGATDSVLSLAGLENADTIFRNQTKSDGTPLGADPVVLLVPNALRISALQHINSTVLAGGGNASALVPSTNPWSGAFQVVSSTYLSRTSLPDGNGVSQTVTGSSTAWYLLADPNNIAAISVVFLFGKEMPTVESSDFEFDRLGIATRAYFDFGCNKHEYRGAVKLKGAA